MKPAPKQEPVYNTRPWSDGEIERLELVYQELGEDKAADSFFRLHNRNPEDTRRKIAELAHPHKERPASAHQRKLPKPSNESGPWTEDEDEMLRQFAAEATKEELYGLFLKRKSIDVDARLAELRLRTLPSEPPVEDEPKNDAPVEAKPSDAGAAAKQKQAKGEARAVDWSAGFWTPAEKRLLREAFRDNAYSDKLLLELFPKHGILEIRQEAYRLGVADHLPQAVRKREQKQKQKAARNSAKGKSSASSARSEDPVAEAKPEPPLEYGKKLTSTGERVERWRLHAGVSVKYMCASLGVKRDEYLKELVGDKTFSVDHLKRAAAACGTTAGIMLGYTPEQAPEPEPPRKEKRAGNGRKAKRGRR